jgi:hypothetical protein
MSAAGSLTGASRIDREPEMLWRCADSHVHRVALLLVLTSVPITAAAKSSLFL